MKENAVPKNTAKNTTWAVSIRKQWSTHRQKSYPGVYSQWPVHLYLADENTLDYWLSKFVIEARNQKGQPYPPNTLYSVCCGLQRYIKEHRPQLNIFSQPQFAGFCKTLDSEMKRLRSLGMGVDRKQAEPLTVEEENSLWEQGLLGDGFPQTLVDTLLSLCGMHFALRSGQEHRSLQVTQIEPSDAPPYLIYTENFFKEQCRWDFTQEGATKLIMEKSQSRYNTTTTRYGMVLAENLRLSSGWNYRMKITAVLQKNTYSQIATGEDNYLAVSQIIQ